MNRKQRKKSLPHLLHCLKISTINGAWLFFFFFLRSTSHPDRSWASVYFMVETFVLWFLLRVEQYADNLPPPSKLKPYLDFVKAKVKVWVNHLAHVIPALSSKAKLSLGQSLKVSIALSSPFLFPGLHPQMQTAWTNLSLSWIWQIGWSCHRPPSYVVISIGTYNVPMLITT